MQIDSSKRQTRNPFRPTDQRPQMSTSQRHNVGLTLIETMITVAIISIMLVIAVPSFSSVRERAALRGAADHMLTVWNLAHFEAVKRNQMVKVGIKTGADGSFCLGAATTNDAA